MAVFGSTTSRETNLLIDVYHKIAATPFKRNEQEKAKRLGKKFYFQNSSSHPRLAGPIVSEEEVLLYSCRFALASLQLMCLQANSQNIFSSGLSATYEGSFNCNFFATHLWSGGRFGFRPVFAHRLNSRSFYRRYAFPSFSSTFEVIFEDSSGSYTTFKHRFRKDVELPTSNRSCFN